MTETLPGNQICEIQSFTVLSFIDEALQLKQFADQLEEGDYALIQVLYMEFMARFVGRTYSEKFCLEARVWFTQQLEKIYAESKDEEKTDQLLLLHDGVTDYVELKIRERLKEISHQKEIRLLESGGYMTLEQLSSFLGMRMSDLQYWLSFAVQKNNKLGKDGLSGDFKILYPGDKKERAMYQSNLARPFLRQAGYKFPSNKGHILNYCRH